MESAKSEMESANFWHPVPTLRNPVLDFTGVLNVLSKVPTFFQIMSKVPKLSNNQRKKFEQSAKIFIFLNKAIFFQNCKVPKLPSFL